MAKQIIHEIDDSTYVTGEYIESPVFGAISPKDLSTGCKAVLILLNEEKNMNTERVISTNIELMEALFHA